MRLDDISVIDIFWLMCKFLAALALLIFGFMLLSVIWKTLFGPAKKPLTKEQKENRERWRKQMEEDRRQRLRDKYNL